MDSNPSTRTLQRCPASGLTLSQTPIPKILFIRNVSVFWVLHINCPPTTFEGQNEGRKRVRMRLACWLAISLLLGEFPESSMAKARGSVLISSTGGRVPATWAAQGLH